MMRTIATGIVVGFFLFFLTAQVGFGQGNDPLRYGKVVYDPVLGHCYFQPLSQGTPGGQMAPMSYWRNATHPAYYEYYRDQQYWEQWRKEHPGCKTTTDLQKQLEKELREKGLRPQVARLEAREIVQSEQAKWRKHLEDQKQLSGYCEEWYTLDPRTKLPVAKPRSQWPERSKPSWMKTPAPTKKAPSAARVVLPATKAAPAPAPKPAPAPAPAPVVKPSTTQVSSSTATPPVAKAPAVQLPSRGGGSFVVRLTAK